ncbi:hypothetical protein ANANG_G00130700 [Anguilla anguilla]|uniref:Uncharacterized protein n=1 Tax=Anguilla anguilla TaxID=7936 RepID=A0A9D3MF61_ANGAN|nr:hypothetical protein ANANG_G00130700 [Anguilla anguilla]
MSNAEDLNRLTACSLVLLGHIFYVLGNHRQLLQDSLTRLSLPTAPHQLDGRPSPVQFQAQNGPTTSLASLL